jgi:hypothetical protein
MHGGLFDSPVFIKDGRYMIREITSVDDAIDFLCDWPEHGRDMLYQLTCDACCASRNGAAPAINAQKAIRSFAQQHGILEDTETTSR